ncbi:hypothetical protein EV193_108212 [Herbihabitans rhizosphaerae]|uniref:SMP-30/gluconolaconase/LRE-like protein n=1 Tax=Herbihabitans rhizosphaerae TaxID=1872711 RepID=A0A4Q7KHU1_9PSEU|nr:hypothetical protein EV193_108212 [Herbihabitans rhizosphaerae]
MPALLPSPRLLTDGLTMVESGRWHEGRLWFAHWASGEVIAVDMEGRSEVVGPGRAATRWAGRSPGCPTAGCWSPARS